MRVKDIRAILESLQEYHIDARRSLTVTERGLDHLNKLKSVYFKARYFRGIRAKPKRREMQAKMQILELLKYNPNEPLLNPVSIYLDDRIDHTLYRGKGFGYAHILKGLLDEGLIKSF
jgi:hypothetical protein